MEAEQQVARHYGRSGIEQAFLDALRAAGKDPDRLSPADLSGSDEFHLGGPAATAALAADLGLGPDAHLLDIGCGVGGPARHLAVAPGCRVTGIDLTAEFVEAGEALTRRCGLAGRVSLHHGSALAMPFPDSGFDAATLLHVGMNIADKAALFAEVKRVLRPGARFGVYDVMRLAEGDLPWPMPWAAAPEASFVETPETYRRLLRQAGFVVEAEHDRGALALRLAREARERAAAQGPSPLGPHLLMGPTARERVGNVMAAVERGLIAPVAMVARAG